MELREYWSILRRRWWIPVLLGLLVAVLSLLQMRPWPDSGPLRDALRCLSREIPAEALVARIDDVPARLRNDLYLAAATRARADGQEKDFQNLLRRCLQSSTPASEWPGPLARRYRSGGSR